MEAAPIFRRSNPRPKYVHKTWALALIQTYPVALTECCSLYDDVNRFLYTKIPRDCSLHQFECPEEEDKHVTALFCTAMAVFLGVEGV